MNKAARRPPIQPNKRCGTGFAGPQEPAPQGGPQEPAPLGGLGPKAQTAGRLCPPKGWASGPARRAKDAAGASGVTCYAAFNHMAVSKALLIIGMFMPKLGLAPFFGAALGAGLTGSCAASFTRSQALDSLARATANE